MIALLRRLHCPLIGCLLLSDQSFGFPAQQKQHTHIHPAMASAAELAALRQEWLGVYTQALQADSWGQVVEAMEGYQQCVVAVCMCEGCAAWP